MCLSIYLSHLLSNSLDYLPSVTLTHFCFESPKGNWQSAGPAQTLRGMMSDQCLHCLHELEEFLKNIVIINPTKHPSVGNRPAKELWLKSPLDVNGLTLLSLDESWYN